MPVNVQHKFSIFKPSLQFGFILACVSLFTVTSLCFAVDDITAMEQAFFHRDYSFDSPDNRIARLEKFMTGKTQDGLFNERLAHLMTIAMQNKVNLESIPLDPDEDLGVDDNTIAALSSPQARAGLLQPPQQYMPPQPYSPVIQDNSAPDVTNYPLVSDMEQKLFHQGFDNEPIANRLSRLEQTIFQQTAPPEFSLQQRVDKLTAKLLPNDPSVTQRRFEAQYSTSSALRNFPQNSAQMAASDIAIYGALNGIEMQVMGKPYSGEPLVQRISRLETRIFGRIQAGTIDSRFDKIAANYQSALQRNWTPQPQAPGLPQNFQLPQHQAMQPIPVGTGNMMFDLANLESRVFGQVFEQNPVPLRLTNLEIQMLNQTFVFMSPQQRMVQLLMRAGQSEAIQHNQVGFR